MASEQPVQSVKSDPRLSGICKAAHVLFQQIYLFNPSNQEFDGPMKHEGPIQGLVLLTTLFNLLVEFMCDRDFIEDHDQSIVGSILRKLIGSYGLIGPYMFRLVYDNPNNKEKYGLYHMAICFKEYEQIERLVVLGVDQQLDATPLMPLNPYNYAISLGNKGYFDDDHTVFQELFKNRVVAGIQRGIMVGKKTSMLIEKARKAIALSNEVL